MPRFFVAASNIFGGVAYLSAVESGHLKALRIRRGECITVCDGEGRDYTCRLKRLSDDGAEAEIVEVSPSRGEPSITCTVFAAFSKGDKLDTLVQKSVEMGATGIVVFPSERCVSRPEGVSALRRVARLQRIAEEAAKQSERGRVPRVSAVPSFYFAAKQAAKADLPLFLYERETERSLKDALTAARTMATVSIVSGPEGGFTPDEAAFATQARLISVSLGPRILRCETAPIAALSAVMYHTGNM